VDAKVQQHRSDPKRRWYQDKVALPKTENSKKDQREK